MEDASRDEYINFGLQEVSENLPCCLGVAIRLLGVEEKISKYKGD